MKTATIENVNKMSKYGLKRRPTYEEITNLISENEKLTGKLPNRDATFFKSSREGSFFDGSDAMEQLREEQGRLLLRQMSEVLLRQNVRTAGKTFHTERMQRLPTTSPVIAQPTQPMDVDEEATTQPTPTQAPPSTRLQQASQMNVELEQRRNTAMKRKEETAMNHRGEIFKQSKPTLAQQILNIQPPRAVPENIPIFSSGDEALQPTKVKRKNLNATVPASSSQAPMDLSNNPKRSEPETRVEPRGKAGRPKMFKHGTDRADGTKRDGEEPEDTTNRKKSKRTNPNKAKIQKRLDAKMAKETVNVEADDADDEDTRKGSRVRKTIEKPTIPSKANIQTIYEALTNAKNKNVITAEEYKEFNDVFQEFRKAKGKEKSMQTSKAKSIYSKLYPKLKKKFNDMK
jgi:hypothetical protein